MDTTTEILPGDIGLVTMNGPTGRLIRLGQWLNGDGFENFEHAFVVTDERAPKTNKFPWMIVEAQPNGAQINEFHYAPENIHWCRGLSHNLTGKDRLAVAQAAIDCIGTPYSFADYASLVALRLHLPCILLRNYVKSSGHMICSQLCAWVYFKAGKPIWPGQDWTGDDTPGDLYQRDMELRGLYGLGTAA